MKQTNISRLRMHLNIVGHITKAEAVKYYNMYGLAEQVRRLKDRGMNVVTVMVPNGNKQDFARYTKVSNE
jgi:hypothetical protein